MRFFNSILLGCLFAPFLFGVSAPGEGGSPLDPGFAQWVLKQSEGEPGYGEIVHRFLGAVSEESNIKDGSHRGKLLEYVIAAHLGDEKVCAPASRFPAPSCLLPLPVVWCACCMCVPLVCLLSVCV